MHSFNFVVAFSGFEVLWFKVGRGVVNCKMFQPKGPLFEGFVAYFGSDVTAETKEAFTSRGGSDATATRGIFKDLASVLNHEEQFPTKSLVIFTELKLATRSQRDRSLSTFDKHIAKVLSAAISSGERISVFRPCFIVDCTKAHKRLPLGKYVVPASYSENLPKHFCVDASSDEYAQECALSSAVIEEARKTTESCRSRFEADTLEATNLMVTDEGDDGGDGDQGSDEGAEADPNHVQVRPNTSSSAQQPAPPVQQEKRRRVSNKKKNMTPRQTRRATTPSKTRATPLRLNAKSPHPSTPRVHGQGREHPPEFLEQLLRLPPNAYVGSYFGKYFPGYGVIRGKIVRWDRDAQVFSIVYENEDSEDSDRDGGAADDGEADEEMGFEEVVRLVMKDHPRKVLMELIIANKENTPVQSPRASPVPIVARRDRPRTTPPARILHSPSSKSANRVTATNDGAQAAKRYTLESSDDESTNDAPDRNVPKQVSRKSSRKTTAAQVHKPEIKKPVKRRSSNAIETKKKKNRPTMRRAVGSRKSGNEEFDDSESTQYEEQAVPSSGRPAAARTKTISSGDWSVDQDQILKAWADARVRGDKETERMCDVLLLDQSKPIGMRLARMADLQLGR